MSLSIPAPTVSAYFAAGPPANRQHSRDIHVRTDLSTGKGQEQQCRNCRGARISRDTTSTCAHTCRCHDPRSSSAGVPNTHRSQHHMSANADGNDTTSSEWQLRVIVCVASLGAENKRRCKHMVPAVFAAPAPVPGVTPVNNNERGKSKGKKGQRSHTRDDPIISAIARLTFQKTQQHRVWEVSLLDTGHEGDRTEISSGKTEL